MSTYLPLCALERHPTSRPHAARVSWEVLAALLDELATRGIGATSAAPALRAELAPPPSEPLRSKSARKRDSSHRLTSGGQ